jgi:hypothetical protein
MTSVLDTIPDDVKDQYHAIRVLPDGRVIGVKRLLFHWTLHVDVNWYGYADNYCYETLEQAMAGYGQWTGSGEPTGWHRHVKTGRRRPNGDPAQEYVNL